VQFLSAIAMSEPIARTNVITRSMGADMRRAVGLDPTAVPMGIPMQTEGGEGSTQTPAPPMPPPAPPPAPAWHQGTMASRRIAAGCTCGDDSRSLELCSTCHAAWWCTGCFAAQCPCVVDAGQSSADLFSWQLQQDGWA
jgi:hypothetical protein